MVKIAFATAAGYPAAVRGGRRSGFGGSILAAAFASGKLLVLTGVVTILVAAAGAAEPADVRITGSFGHDHRSC
jgi:hypothetical protein